VFHCYLHVAFVAMSTHLLLAGNPINSPHHFVVCYSGKELRRWWWLCPTAGRQRDLSEIRLLNVMVMR